MSRHGLNQFLNSIGVCLVMLTGLGVGVWFAQQNQPTQRRVAQHPAEYEYDAEFETDEEWEAPLRRQASRRVATKPSTARRPAIQQRTSTRSGIRQAAFQEEEDETLIPEPLEAEEAEVPDEEMEAETDPESVPARVAALPPGTVPLVGAALGQATGLRQGITGITLEQNNAQITNNTIPVTTRAPVAIEAKVAFVNPLPQGTAYLRIKWSVRRPIQAGFEAIPSIDTQESVVPTGGLNSPHTQQLKLKTAGKLEFIAELLDGKNQPITATTASTSLTIQDNTTPLTNAIKQFLIPNPASPTDNLLFPANVMGLLLNERTFSVEIDHAPPQDTQYQLVTHRQGVSTNIGNLVQTGTDKIIKVESTKIGTLAAGEYQLWLVDDWTGAAFTTSGSIRVPELQSSHVAKKLSALKYSPSYYAPVVALATPNLCYPGYLKISGNGWDASVRDAKFYLLTRKTQTGPYSFVGEVTATKSQQGNGDWTAEFELPDFQIPPATPQIRLIPISLSGFDHVYSDPLDLNQQSTTISSIKPVINVVKKTGSPTSSLNKPGDAYFSRELKVVVSVAGTNMPTDAAMLVRDNKTQAILGNAKVANASSIDVDVTLPGFGEFELVAVLSQGPATNLSQVSAPVKVLVVNQGPTVADVIPKNFGSEAIGNDIKITFDTPVGLKTTYTSEQLAGQFELKRRYGRNDSRLEAVFEIATATLSTDNKTVVLKTKAEPVVDSYRLIIKGTLEDALGNKLRGDGLNAGTEYSIVLSPGVALAGGFEPDVPARTAVEHVEYGEYTKTRTNPDTFLPSDHVETRVARLYYYRDAHRVAQIINREVQSLNRAAAAQKRQLADKARREAEQGTKERRTYEMWASQLAQKARLAEEELARDEQDRAAALQQIETVTQQIEADEVRLSEWRADLNTLTSTTTPPLPTQQQLLQLKEQIQETERNVANARNRLTAVKADLQATTARISRGVSAVQAARDSEIKANNDAVAAEQTEALLSADRFRREVAAAHEDPDTYAAGNPNSNDPVAQVTISVIGEGVIQLRGPLSGVNKIRTMINEIDQPVGQVRISIHTAQVNGEHGDRMEKVVNRIEDHIEHAKFLTTRTTEMLRQSIVEVAAEKATQAAEECEGEDQFARDEKYLYAFFGKDFVDELRDMDSEFLKTGNKLLSIHSMDTTSLASSLFVLALAKNETRQEILALFNCRLIEELPPDEKKYYMAGYRPHFWGDGKNKTRKLAEFGKGEDKRLMALNAKFANFSGYFNNHVSGTDTLNPAQREFIKLAQIFKSRLITEVELRQRIVERGLIEQKNPNDAAVQNIRLQLSLDAREVTFKAQGELAKQLISIQTELEALAEVFKNDLTAPSVGLENEEARMLLVLAQGDNWRSLLAGDQAMKDRVTRSGIAFMPSAITDLQNKRVPQSPVKFNIRFDGISYPVYLNFEKSVENLDATQLPRIIDATIQYNSWAIDQPENGENEFKKKFSSLIDSLNSYNQQLVTYLEKFYWNESQQSLLNAQLSYLKEAQDNFRNDKHNSEYFRMKNIQSLVYARFYLEQLSLVAKRKYERHKQDLDAFLSLMRQAEPDFPKIIGRWRVLRTIINEIKPGDPSWATADKVITNLDKKFVELQASFEKAAQAERVAKIFDNELDHRRFLDFLIAETEDKYIELLEGTRSHTANIDNYIKRLITALDDDFNTQFYKPAFQGVRQASRLWDVNLSQIETTSILTNNRQFGKVSPQATMEFDLPKRDILIQEAFKGAKASFDEYGALMNDPTFLAMAKLRSGQPTSSPSQRGAGDSAVRNVLPGLPSTTDEHILGQAGPGNREFDSPLESLIPDPAIYKFETGTGFEVRPVIQPDGQAVVFHFQYLYRANIREPIRADEKHLGRVKEHFIDTDVQLSNFELRKVSDYVVALKTSRTSRGVPLMEDLPGVGMLFRPLPSAESSLQQNVVMAQATIFPTLFDLMGLRWAPAVVDIDQFELQNENYTVRGRRKAVSDRVYDFSSDQVDDFLQIEEDQRRKDLYRNQKPIGTRLPFPYPNPNEYEVEEDGSPDPSATPGSEGLVPEPLEDDGLNPRGITVPEPAAKRGQPTRQAQRPRSTGVELLPPPPQSDTTRRSAPGSVPLPPPRTQQRTQPRGPQFVEPVPLPSESSRTSPNQRRGLEQLAPAPRRQAENTQPRLIDPVNYEVDARSSTKPAATNTAGRASVGRASVGQGPATTNAPAAKAPAGKSLLPWFKKSVK